jgi:YihY family inner membrane protein
MPSEEQYIKQIDKLIKWFDNFQHKHSAIGFPVAVLKKYGDDEAGNQVALITYFGFVSLFPLLLILFSILNTISRTNKGFEERVINAVLQYFPGSADQIANNIHGYQKTGFSLIVIIIITLYGARGISSALQNASNKLWQIPKNERPNFWNATARNFGIIIFGGGGMIMTTLLLSYVNNISSKGLIFKIIVTFLTLILNSLVFTLVFRLATVPAVKSKWLVNGAIVAAVFWQILQYLGSYLVLHQLKRSSQLYGIFALVLGMLFWIYLQAEVTLYAIEINVVRIKKLWPIKIFEDSK